MAIKDLLKRKMTTVPVEEPEPVDPIIEKIRLEKFSTPIIPDDDDFEASIQKVEKVIKTSTPASVTAPVTAVKKPGPARPVRPKYDTGYQMSEVISPIYGRKEEEKKPKTKPAAQPKKKMVTKPIEDQIVPIISPIYGVYKVEPEVEKEEKIVEPVQKRSARKQTIKKEPETVTEDLRNIANMIQDGDNQLKLVEKRTGEFQFDFSKMKSEEPSLIDEIDDAMTLDELMSLYEKKFREEDE